jgi:hypothetical protein
LRSGASLRKSIAVKVWRFGDTLSGGAERHLPRKEEGWSRWFVAQSVSRFRRDIPGESERFRPCRKAGGKLLENLSKCHIFAHCHLIWSQFSAAHPTSRWPDSSSPPLPDLPGGDILTSSKVEASTVIHRLSPVVTPALALALAACATDAPTTPPAQAPDAPSLAVSGERLDALVATLDDANVRLLPALGDADAQSRLAADLARVNDALAGGDANALAASLDAAHATLAEIQALDPESSAAADLDALALALAGVGEALPASHVTQQ